MQKILQKFKKILYSSKFFERRKFPRYQPKKAVVCKGIYSWFGKKFEIDLVIINISKGGLLVSSSQNKLPPSVDIEIKFFMPASETISVFGQVGRTYKPYKQKCYYSSIEFGNLDDKNIDKIISYLK